MNVAGIQGDQGRKQRFQGARLEGCQIDILKIDIEGGEYELLGDPRFASLDVKAIVLEWHACSEILDGEKWCRDRLKELGYRLYPIFQRESYGMFWAYKTNDGADGDSLRWRRDPGVRQEDLDRDMH